MDFVLAYVTVKDKEEAVALGKKLLEERLAACVNILDGATSIYRWEGKICTDAEAVLIAKTSAERFHSLSERIKELHSYDCPCVLSIPVNGGSKQYLEWLAQEI